MPFFGVPAMALTAVLICQGEQAGTWLLTAAVIQIADAAVNRTRGIKTAIIAPLLCGIAHLTSAWLLH